MLTYCEYMHVCVCTCTYLCLIVSETKTPWTVALQAPLSMEFSSQEYWSGLSLPYPRYLPDTGIEHSSLASSPLAGRFFKIYHKHSLGSPLHTLAIVNSDAMNFEVHISFWISVFVSFENIPRN